MVILAANDRDVPEFQKNNCPLKQFKLRINIFSEISAKILFHGRNYFENLKKKSVLLVYIILAASVR